MSLRRSLTALAMGVALAAPGVMDTAVPASAATPQFARLYITAWSPDTQNVNGYY